MNNPSEAMQRVQSIVHSLDHWYLLHAQPFSWRDSRALWSVWVSEVMLQQTRTATVERHFGRFMELFPNYSELAQANEEAVASAWQGLGYYRRARLLHKAAQQLCEWGEPARVDQLERYAGIGAYTSRSIAAIALDLPVLPVDGNIARLVARLEGWTDARLDLPASLVGQWEQALAHTGPYRAVQAAMEVGSTLCLPKAPRCDQCPLGSWCHARQYNPTDFGRKPVRKAPSRHAVVVWVIQLPRESGVLLIKRPSGLLGNQWSLPMMAADQDVAGLPGVTDVQEVGQFVHRFTHRVFDVKVIAATAHSTGFTGNAPKWVHQAIFDPGKSDNSADSHIRHALTTSTHPGRLVPSKLSLKALELASCA